MEVKFLTLTAISISIATTIGCGAEEIYQKLGQKIDLSLMFRNQNSQTVTLRDVISKQPVSIFTLNYYRCTTMCTLQFANLASTLKKIGAPIGKNFRIATISFDPTDTPTMALEKQKLWIPQTGQNNAQWDFYVGDKKNITALTKELNFYYEQDGKEYAHAAALFFIKSDGTFDKYLYGMVYEPHDLAAALIETSNGTVGSFWQKIRTKFLHYQPMLGKYQ